MTPLARRYLFRSSATGAYLADVALLMAVQGPALFGDLSHDQPTLPKTVSGSVSPAVSLAPTWGCAGNRVTVPGSSPFVTFILTVIVSESA